MTLVFTGGEEEILFPMHWVFRLEQLQQNDKDYCIWQVDLTLCDENDPQLQILAKMMKDETSGSTGWYRLGELLM